MKLSTDITYLPTTEGFIYLSVIQDLCNNEILSYSISSRNNLELVFSTLLVVTLVKGIPSIIHVLSLFFAFKNRAIYQKTVNEQKSNRNAC